MERNHYEKYIRDKSVFLEESEKKVSKDRVYEKQYTQHELFVHGKTGEAPAISKTVTDNLVHKTKDNRNPVKKEKTDQTGNVSFVFEKDRKEEKSRGKYSGGTTKRQAKKKIIEGTRQKEHFKTISDSIEKKERPKTESSQKSSFTKKVRTNPKTKGRYKNKILAGGHSTQKKVITDAMLDASVTQNSDYKEEQGDISREYVDRMQTAISYTPAFINKVMDSKYIGKTGRGKNKKKNNKKEKVQSLYREQTYYKRYRQKKQEPANLTQSIEEKKQQLIKIIHKIKEIFASHKTAVIAVIAVILCLVSLISALFSLGIGIADGIGIYLMGTSMAEDLQMTDADSYFTEKEMLLQERIDAIEEEFPDFDEYVLDIDEIGHDPILLMAFLSSVYESYTLEEAQDVLDTIFENLYTLELVEATEERIKTVYNEELDAYEEVKYTVTVLYVTLTRNNLEDILINMLPDDKSRELFDIYRDTQGAHQSFSNPFEVDWSQYVSSDFGWRIHPISGQEKFHNGVDIAMPIGTTIKSCSRGVVVLSYYSDSAGHYVVVEDESGYTCHYMHLDVRSVSAGDKVDYGDEIGKVGNTGNSTGPHLHLGVKNQYGDWLNPVFVVSTYVN